MHQNMIHALQTLYGSSEHPVCVADRSFRIVWQNHEEAAKLVGQLCVQALAGSESLYYPAVPADRTFLVHTQGKTMRCTLQPLSFDQTAYFLLFFEPASEGASMSVPELRAVLAQQADACRELAAMLVHVSRPMVQNADEIGLPLDADTRQSYLQTQDIIYTLMRRSLCCTELLWYENFSDAQTAELAVQDIGTVMRRLSTQIDLISGDWLEVQNEDIACRLYAPIDCNRLTYAVLVLISAALEKHPVSGALSCKARQQQEQIQIEICFAPHPEGHARALPPKQNSVLSDAGSDQTILRRFCDAFRIEIAELPVPGCFARTLSIPAHAAGSSCSILRSDRETYGAPDRFSVSHIMLSDILPTETFFETEENLR